MLHKMMLGSKVWYMMMTVTLPNYQTLIFNDPYPYSTRYQCVVGLPSFEMPQEVMLYLLKDNPDVKPGQPPYNVNRQCVAVYDTRGL